jgi:hypothetical protein
MGRARLGERAKGDWRGIPIVLAEIRPDNR